MGQHAPDYFPIDDDHPAHPRSTYGMMKRLGEQMCEYFTFNTGITTICLRPPGVTQPEYYAHARERRAADPESEWRQGWEYGAICHVEDVAAAAVLGLTCPDPGHVTLLLCADDIASDTPSREMAAKVHPEVPWRGGAEYETDPFKALVDNSKAKRILGWQPKYSWRETAKPAQAS
jgi:nucleoside-diphosphate-sugar epimerase